MYSTSGDVFCEVLVPHRKGGAEYGRIALAIVIGILVSSLIFLFIPSMLFLLIIVWAIVVFVVKLQKTEYEYTFTSGDLDIDKISGDYKRKRKMTISMDEIELVAPADSHELDAYRHGNYKTIDYSANDPSQKNYVMVGSWQSSQVKVIITPNERLLDHMFNCAPRKVKRV